MKYLFPILLQKTMKSGKNKKIAIQITFNLFVYLEKESRPRVIKKIVEKDFQKLEVILRYIGEFQKKLDAVKAKAADSAKLYGLDKEEEVEKLVRHLKMEAGLLSFYFLNFIALFVRSCDQSVLFSGLI